MQRVTKTSALAIATLALVVVMMLALVVFGPAEEEVGAASAPALFDQELVQDIYRRTGPAVVVVRTGRIAGNSFVQDTIGSGFLLDQEGYIVTNEHVIRGGGSVVVEFPGGIPIEAAVSGISLGNDLALLKVDPSWVAGISPVELGDSSQVRPGQLAIALGSPFGLGGSISVGVVSGIDRVLGSDYARPVHGILQTDAATNPGDSGGPLLDREGKVVGINTSVQVGLVSEDNQSAGRRIGFALPVNTLIRLLPRLKTAQVVKPTFMGIAVTPVSAVLAQRVNLSLGSGVYITRVLAGSPADRAGLVPAISAQRGLPVGGDVITAVDGILIASVADFFAELDKHSPGDRVPLKLVRNGKEAELVVTLDEWPAGVNPFTNSPDVIPIAGNGSSASQYPFVPRLPGFSFPGLYPENP